MNEKTEQGKSVGYWMKWKQEKAERVQWLLDEINKIEKTIFGICSPVP